jgi:hypothetical protein
VNQFAPVFRVATSWYGSLLTVFAAALLVIAVGLGDPGLWEPQELGVADRVVARLDRADPTTEIGKAAIAAKVEADKAKTALSPQLPVAIDSCAKVAPEKPVARSFDTRAIEWGITTFGMTDAGMRAPFAILGIICALAICGIGIRLGSGRAGLIAGIVGLSFPLLVLSSKQLTSEIATATGAALLVYGGVALSHRRPPFRSLLGVTDVVLSLATIVVGAVVAFVGGGALLGILIPVGAVAASAGFGYPALKQMLLRKGANATPLAPGSWIGLVAAIVACVVLYVLCKQMYSLKEPITGGRELFGKSIVPSGCYSWALGGIWPPDDNLRMTYESSIEQIAFGTYPWGILAPIAMASLLASLRPGRRRAAALTLAWAGGSWIVTEAFQRKIGFTIWAGFPALAVVIGVWLDGLLEARAAHEASSINDSDGSIAPYNLQIGLFIFLGILVLGKDLQQFPQRISSLLVGNDGVKYPANTSFAGVPTRLWILTIGGYIAGNFAYAMWTYNRWRRWSNRMLYSSIACSVVMAMFWSFGWHRSLSANLSTKQIFESYRSLRKEGDRLFLMGDLGNAPRYYAGNEGSPMFGYDKLFTEFAKATPRAFAVVPGQELCAIHREANGRPYFVVDDANARSLLISNSVEGTIDRNPLATAVLRAEPKNIGYRPAGKVVYDNRIEIIGWNMPPVVERGSTFDVTLFYKVLQTVPANYKVFMHVDGSGLRFNGDHEPIGGRCATTYWKVGDYIADTFSVDAGGSTFPSGDYDVWVGFFTGSSPTWHNMPVSNAPPGSRDNADRVRLLKLKLD